MSRETAKANVRRMLDPLFRRVFHGRGLDVGAGNDPLNPVAFPGISSVVPFDTNCGDAQTITKFVSGPFDFVYSSNCLEHMVDPVTALAGWASLVRPGGWMVVVVPDEDLYEQGHFPSVFNADHKWTFTIHKKKSWSPKSVNMFDLLIGLSEFRIVRLGVVDTLYDYSRHGQDQTWGDAEAFIEAVLCKEG